jgi:hypothetical protein
VVGGVNKEAEPTPFTCAQCAVYIRGDVYRAFDSSFCSSFCRNERVHNGGHAGRTCGYDERAVAAREAGVH